MTRKKPKRFTFKKEPRETGLRAVGHPYQGVNIKLAGKNVGFIYPPSWNSKRDEWKVSLMIRREPTAEWASDFTWANVKTLFKTEQEARDYLQANFEKIVLWDLHSVEE
jgi:hypothetical protein